MKQTLICNLGKYQSNGRIYCTKERVLCPNVRYRPCVGWYVQTEFAADCPKRGENNGETG